MLRRVAEVLGASVRVTITPNEETAKPAAANLSETPVTYKIRRKP